MEKAEQDLTSDVLETKKAWFTYNGGVYTEPGSETGQKHKKPLFFDIALNYVQLDMDRLLERAGKQPAAPTVQASKKAEEKMEAVKKTKAEEPARIETPEPNPSQSTGGLSSLLGGWWGRK
jgi:signal recognition particle subunit SRP68